jgi:hypothetical protein
MSGLQEFVADLLEQHGAVVEALEPDIVEVLAPDHVRQTMGWPELARLGFGARQAQDTIPIGLEGDWLDRFGALLTNEGRWSERLVEPVTPVAPPADPERILERTLDLPNAVWRFQGMTAAYTRCLMLAFRYTATSDEKRDGVIWVGFNLGTGAVLNDLLARLRTVLAEMPGWRAPDPAVRLAAGPDCDWARLEARLRLLIDWQVRESIEPYLRAMRRRLDRDRRRIHSYHNDLRGASLKRLSALSRAHGDRAENDRRRETMRIEAVEREYRAKLDDLRHNYALRIAVEGIQALQLYVPVQRFNVLIRRRKGERVIRLDWHPLLKSAEPPLCEAGIGRDRVRLVCDENLHLTDPAGQAPCPSCGKPFCRACFAEGCPRCRRPAANAPAGGRPPPETAKRRP